MKKLLLLFFIGFSVSFFSSCDEIPPQINPQMGPIGNPNDTTSVDNQQRQVLVEEFTGVDCVNCPDGSQAIETLLDIYGEQLIAISIHAGFFAPPIEESQYDFRTQEGDLILSYLGEPLGYPTGVVNRKKFDGEFDLQLGKGQWAGFIAEEVAIAPSVKIEIEPAFDISSRELDVDVTLHVQENITDPDVRISVMVLEDDIIDAQVTPDGVDEGYKHKHVLRDMLTNYDGDILSEDLIASAQIEKSFSSMIPEGWVAANCKVVVFVSLGGQLKDVLQAHQVKMVE